MAESRINGEVKKTSPSRPVECTDDRPPAREMSVMESTLAQALTTPGTDLDPGKTLRGAREARGLSLQDISRTTKIGVSILTALEQNQIEKLPAKVFTRGFIKAYANEVGLDPDETADLYLAQIAPESLVVDGETARLNVVTPAERTEVLAYDDDTTKLLQVRQAGRFGGLFTAAAAVGLAVYIWSFSWDRRDATQQQQAVNQPAATDVTQAAATPQPAAADAVPAVAQAIETPAGPLRLRMKLQGPCWLVASADGERVVARLLQPGEEQTIEANEELVLRIGDPGAVSYSINGRQGLPFGRAGEPVNIRITKENFRHFIHSS